MHVRHRHSYQIKWIKVINLERIYEALHAVAVDIRWLVLQAAAEDQLGGGVGVGVDAGEVEGLGGFDAGGCGGGGVVHADEGSSI